MSATIDQKVLEMRFDNKKFESNVQDSLSSIEKLKQSLNFTGVSKGFESINSAAKNCNMSGLASAVETVQAKFSALQVMAVTALSGITLTALNAGKKIASALTIDPIKTGLNEYETKINAVQTIMSNTASKGTTMSDVTKTLDELNTYADKTIYNFAEMTKNIGTFTAAGVGLKESASAIKGISNLAAASGSTTQQAATAMYQLSQALSSGTVKLMDWNSVVNAGMGGEKFQEALKQTAREHKVSIDSIIDSNGSFRESLQEGWLSADILNETLNKFTVDGATNYSKSMIESGKWTQKQADALITEAQAMEDAATKVKTFTQLFDTLKESLQSGWAKSWEITVGDFEEAKDFFTDVNDVFGKFIGTLADTRNDMLIGWKDLGGRTKIIEALRNSFDGISSVVKPVTEAFKEIFPPITAKQLFEFSEAVRQLTAGLKISDETSANLKSTFKGLFAVLDITKQAFSAVFKALTPLFGGLGKLGGGILGVTASFGEWLVKLNETIKTTNVFDNTVQGIIDFVTSASITIKNFVKSISDKFNINGFEIFHSLLERVHARMSQVGEVAGKMKFEVITAVDSMGKSLSDSKFLQMLQALWSGVKTIAKGISSAFGVLTAGVAEKIGNADFKGILDVINGLITGGIGIGLMKFISTLTDVTKEGKGFLGGIKGIKDAILDTFGAIQTQLKAGTLIKIASAIALLSGAILVISLIDSKKLTASLGAITVLFADLMTSMAIFNKISGNVKGVFKTCTIMISLSASVLILASALKKIGELDFDKMVTGLVGIAGLTAIMISASKVIGNGTTTIIKGATQMVIFAVAIKILTSACADLAQLSFAQLAKGLVGVGVLMAEISLFLNTAKFSGKSIATATGIVILAAGIKILSAACKDFAQMKFGEIGKGLTAIGGLLAEIAIFTKLTGNAKGVLSTGVALIAIGAAMKILASALNDFSNMSWEELAKGLVGMAGALLAVTIAVKFMPKNMIGMGVGLIAISTALSIMAGAFDKLGGMSWSEVAKGLTAFGGAMAILAVGLNVMNGTLAGSAAMLVAVAALAVLTPVLSVLGAMSWEGIAKGLVAIAGAFTVIGVAGMVLTPIIPTILALGGAFALIGVGVFGIGAGLLVAGAGLSAIAIGVAALSTSLAAGATGITASLVVIISGIIGLIPAIIEKIGEGIISLCKVIANGAPAIAQAVKAIVLSLVEVLIECVPAIANGALELVVGVMQALVEHTPKIIDALFQFLIGILEGIAKNLPGLIMAAIKVLMSFFQGVVDALNGIDISVLLKGIAGIGMLSAIMIALAAVALLTPAAMIGVVGMGLVIAELGIMLSNIGKLAQIPGLAWLIGEGGKLLQGIGVAIGSFIGGIVGGFMGGVSSQFPKIATDLSAFMKNVQPFIEGSKSIDASSMNGVKALAETILILTAANILDGLTSWLTGGSSMIKFGQELAEFGPYFKKYYDSVKGMDGSVVEASANAAKSLGEMARNLPKNGGVIGWFTGENTLSAFSKELALFGPSLKAYATSVSGLDPNVVINSTNAARALSELADNLPNTGGIVSWFTGDNDIGSFGKSLVSFGNSFATYSGYMKNVDAGIVSTTTNAAKSIVELQKSLPKDGGWFSDEMTLSKFGGDMASFGYYLNNYYGYISGINIAQLSEVIKETNNLVSMAKGMTGLDIGGMTNFGNALTTLGETGVSGFIGAFTNASSKVIASVTNMISLFINSAKSKTTEITTTFATITQSALTAINGKQFLFNTAGQTLMINFIAGIRIKDFTVSSTMSQIISGALTVVKNKYPEFDYVGQTLMVNFISGIRAKDYAVSSTFMQVVSGALTDIRNKYSDFYNAGAYLADGFAEGIRANAYRAAAEARAMAAAAAGATAQRLDEHSPSKVGYKIGNFFGLAFVMAIKDYKLKAYNAGSSMANSAKSGLSEAIANMATFIDSNIDTQPTIRPVLDLSDVMSGTSKLSTLFSRNQALSISNGMMSETDDRFQNGTESSGISNSYQFTQNNYSPKALSRLDIYRQTKNQFSAMKGLVKV